MKRIFTLFTKISLVFIVAVLAASFSLKAQTNLGYSLAKSIGGGGDDQAYTIKVDGSGNVYISGYFSGTVDFDPGSGTFSLTAAGVWDIFFAKYDASGNLIYAKRLGGTNYEIASGMAIDGSGNVYLTGYFIGTSDFNPDPAVQNNLTSGSYDAYFAKYDAAGNYVFANKVGDPAGGQDEEGYSIILDGSGNIYITGFYESTAADFDPGAGTFNLSLVGARDIFIAKYNNSGVFQYAVGMGSTSEEYGTDLMVNGLGNIVVGGYFKSTVDFDPGPGISNLTSAGDFDIFLVTLNAMDGSYENAFQIGGTGSDICNDISINSANDIYVTGFFNGTVDFDPGAAGTNNLTTAGGQDIFLAKYNSSGSYVYAINMGGTGNDIGEQLTLDATGNVYLTGSFSNTADFNPGAGTNNIISAGNMDIFISKYDNTGNYVYAKGMGGSLNEVGLSIALDGTGSIYNSGYYFGTADFDPNGGQVNQTSAGGRDIYIAKYTECTSASLTTRNTQGNETISGTTPLTDGGCLLIANVAPNGGSPISGMVNGKVWIESNVPTYAGQPFVARHYEITPATNPTTATGRVTLYFTQTEFNDFNAHPSSAFDLPTGPSDIAGKANLRIGKYAGTSSDGTGLPGSYSSGATVIDPADADIVWNATLSRWEVSFNVTGFSGFIVQTNGNVLPLTLLEFKARVKNNDALLNWKTENEVNADHFVVERSTDGRTYTNIGTVTARNTSSSSLYDFTDASITTLGVPVVYYRLQQSDKDGRSSYSKIVALPLNTRQSFVMLYPNPVQKEINLSVSVQQAGKVQGSIFDNTGRMIKQMQWQLTAGSTTLSIDAAGLAKGIYYLEIKGEQVNERKQFIKQ